MLKIFVMIGLLICNTAFSQDKVFYEVDVVGLDQIQKEDLVPVLKPFVGKPFTESFQKDLHQALAEISMFESASFKLQLNQTLQLFIQEKKARAWIDFENPLYVSEKGKIFEGFGSFAPQDLPQIKGNWKDHASVLMDEVIFSSGVALIASIESHLGVLPNYLVWDGEQGWSFALQDIDFIFFIAKDGFDFKLRRYLQIQKEIMAQKDKIVGIDLDFRDRIVVKLKPPSDS